MFTPTHTLMHILNLVMYPHHPCIQPHMRCRRPLDHSPLHPPIRMVLPVLLCHLCCMLLSLCGLVTLPCHTLFCIPTAAVTSSMSPHFSLSCNPAQPYTHADCQLCYDFPSHASCHSIDPVNHICDVGSRWTTFHCILQSGQCCLCCCAMFVLRCFQCGV